MKQSAKMITAAMLLSTVFCLSAFAQQSVASAKKVYKRSEVLSGNSTTVSPHAKVEASFLALFPLAARSSWAAIDDNNYYVSFLNNGKKANASFSVTGKMNYCITDCPLENLPPTFSKIIEKEYAGYRYLKGTQIAAYSAVVYQAIVENFVGFKTLRFTEEGVEEIGEVKKQ